MAYAYEAYGLKTSFMTGWLLSLTYIGVVVFEVISVGWVAGALFPALEGRVLYSFLGDNVFLGSVLVGILGSLVLAFVNYRGAGMAATFQDLPGPGASDHFSHFHGSRPDAGRYSKLAPPVRGRNQHLVVGRGSGSLRYSAFLVLGI